MDGHGVVGLIAPRAAAIADGWTDHEGDTTFADEMNVKEPSLYHHCTVTVPSLCRYLYPTHLVSNHHCGHCTTR